jgi:hypothetical protein
MVVVLTAAPAAAQQQVLSCDAVRSAPLVPDSPADRALCERLWPIVREPGALPLDEYEEAEAWARR